MCACIRYRKMFALLGNGLNLDAFSLGCRLPTRRCWKFLLSTWLQAKRVNYKLCQVRIGVVQLLVSRPRRTSTEAVRKSNGRVATLTAIMCSKQCCTWAPVADFLALIVITTSVKCEWCNVSGTSFNPYVISCMYYLMGCLYHFYRRPWSTSWHIPIRKRYDTKHAHLSVSLTAE